MRGAGGGGRAGVGESCPSGTIVGGSGRGLETGGPDISG